MSDITVSNAAPALGWQLLAEYRATSWPGSDRGVAEQVTGMMQELGLHPRQLEQIQKAALAAVQRASRLGQLHRPVSPARLRIWVAGGYARGRSWGFFIVEKPGGDLQGAPLETEPLVELFLYQEQGS